MKPLSLIGRIILAQHAGRLYPVTGALRGIATTGMRRKSADSDNKVSLGLNDRDHFVTSADEGRTIVCYHPERAFPYEHTQPVPRGHALLHEDGSIIKVQFRQDWIDESAKEDKELDFVQLARIFHQDKYTFLPRPSKVRKGRHVQRTSERDGI